MRLTKILGEFNGVVIGTVIGLGVYIKLVSGDFTLVGLITAMIDVGGYALGASTSTLVTSSVTKYPLGPVLAGTLGGVIGAILSLYLPLVTTLPLSSDLLEQVVTGLIAGGVIGILTRFLPGL
ncbi:hypothetical protein [Candidatus Halobonum tyrrellensis]|uniref:hypothetical protein n=1 Tax=Candidatus Halobonum tyrrellensis TaxID=1431545 RepID=UPI0012680E8A|nr:hypothetical protein [Candidatus Halobonum tyrrellensis]